MTTRRGQSIRPVWMGWALLTLALMSPACVDGLRSGPDLGSPADWNPGAIFGEDGTMTVVAADERARVSIPDGALGGGVTITVAAHDGAPDGHLGQAYDYGPEGTTFEEPVTITIAYDPEALHAGTPESELGLGTWQGEAWVAVDGGGVDLAARAVYGQTTHFSLYAVIHVEPAPTPCEQDGEACGADEICDRHGCGDVIGADVIGACVPVPPVCPDKSWDPVCGCDGRTYTTDCERLTEGIARDHAGACAGCDGGLEVCDGVDNDCDGETDEGCPTCEPSVEVCDGEDNDCDGETDEGHVCCVPEDELCDGEDNDCDGETDEGDVCCVPQDETCDGLDNDCDGETDEGDVCCVPQDELCNGVDDDCDGETDEGCPVCEPTLEVCDGVDNDCDGEIDAADPDMSDPDGLLVTPDCELALGVCAGAAKPASLCVGGAWLPCDADTYTSHDDSYQADEEVCDGLDNDCDGETDEHPGCCEPALEICDGEDNDCDGEIDEGEVCCVPVDEVCNELDDDCDGLTDEGEVCCALNEELCDGVDNDCDDEVDEGGDALCDDGKDCTVEVCDPAAGGCVYEWVEACASVCVEHADCGRAQRCSDGVCQRIPGFAYPDEPQSPLPIPDDGSALERTVDIAADASLDAYGVGAGARVVLTPRVKVMLAHEQVADLEITLVHGDKELRLVSAGAADGAGRHFAFGMDAEAGYDLPEADLEDPVTGLRGDQVKGSWTLFISDHAAGAAGALLGWRLVFVEAECLADLDCDDGDACTVDTCADNDDSYVFDEVTVAKRCAHEPSTAPHGDEVCNDLDDDCDGEVDEGDVCCVPADEICNDVDDDCDGEVDEGDVCCVPVDEVCNDLDDDCDGEVDEGDVCCVPVDEVCNDKDDDCDGEVDEGEVCCVPADEICNDLDDDCDGETDEGEVCCVPADEVCNDLDDDCDGETDEGGICCVPKDELCDGVDNDCDGEVDEDCWLCGGDSDCPTAWECEPSPDCACDPDDALPPGAAAPWAGDSGATTGTDACACPETCQPEDPFPEPCSTDATSGAACPDGQSCECLVDPDCPGCDVCYMGCLDKPCVEVSLEVCDGVDNDCDGEIDEDCPICDADADCPQFWACEPSPGCDACVDLSVGDPCSCPKVCQPQDPYPQGCSAGLTSVLECPEGYTCECIPDPACADATCMDACVMSCVPEEPMQCGPWAKQLCASDEICLIQGCDMGHGSCLDDDICEIASSNEPICGCDGVTYDSLCGALDAGVAVKQSGSCE